MKSISLGGIKDSSFFLGHGYVYVESGPGKILQNIIDSKIINPIIYFDELDKVSDTSNGKDIYSVLSNLTDPTQNSEFTDHYFYGMKFDLSKVLYIFTFNDITRIDKILADRLNIIQITPPSINETCTILMDYCIPEIIKNIGIRHNIKISKQQVLSLINTFCANIDKNVSSGIREYYRIVEKIFLEVNKDLLLQTFTIDKEPFYIPQNVFENYIKIIKNNYIIQSQSINHSMYS
jgi:ATP-dependent Lon protease